MQHHIPKVLLAAAVLGLCGLAAGQTVVVLPDLGNTRLTGISDDGLRVAATIGGNNPGYYFWNGTTGYLRVNQTVAFPVGLPVLSGDGHTLAGVSRQTSSFNQGFVASDSGTTTILPLTSPGLVNQSLPTGLSRDGAAVCGWDSSASSSVQVGWRWTATGGMQALPFQVATAISGDGNTVFGSSGAGTHFVWRNGVATQVQTGEILAVNYDASIYAGFGGPTGMGIWRSGIVTGIPLLPGYGAGRFSDISEDGTIAVGTMSDGSSVSPVFVWTAASGTQEIGAYFASLGIDLSAFHIFDAHVSADGRTFALTTVPVGGTLGRGVVVSIPSPGAGCLAAALIARRQRKR